MLLTIAIVLVVIGLVSLLLHWLGGFSYIFVAAGLLLGMVYFLTRRNAEDNGDHMNSDGA